ncbi:MAG: FAD-dependent monooxygenase [Hyphomicrobiales bacterium]|nr:FAD-dependent monooxygenase [Hyphomicrobiales bacterium]
MRAIIAGGGIGGLTAALAFHHVGWEVVVLEQERAPLAEGAGIQLSPNGCKILRALRLEEAAKRVAHAPNALAVRDGMSGEHILRLPLGKGAAERRWGAPYVQLQRSDLLDILRTALEARAPGALHKGVRVLGYANANDNAGGHVTALATGRTQWQGDLLVAADGVHSALRTQMLGEARPRFTGYAAWRAVVPTEALGEYAPLPNTCLWLGRDQHAVTYRLRRGELVNFVGVVPQAIWSSDSWRAQGRRADARAQFAGWHQSLRKVLDEAHPLYFWGLLERSPLPRWHDGLAVLMGDAAHAMLPFMAQGAVMAMEDGWRLAQLCADANGRLETALRQFYRQRRARTHAAQRASQRNGAIFHRRNLAGQALHGAPRWLTRALAPRLLAARLNRFYGYDATAG